MSSLASLRQLSFPLVFYVFGRAINVSKTGMQKSIRFFIKMSMACVLFGAVEMALGDHFWDVIGIKEYSAFKGFDRFIVAGELVPGAFYSYDFTPILSRIRRMASLFVDPVILGQTLGIAFIIAFFYGELTSTRSKRLAYSGLLGLGLLLTIAKGGIVIAAISTLMLMRKLWNKRIFSTLCTIIAIAFAVEYIGFGLSNTLSVSAHIAGLWSGIDLLKSNLFGVGMGGYGNIGNMFSEGYAVEGSESFIGAALGQIGIFAILIYVLFFFAFFKKLKKMSRYDNLSEILLWLNVSLLITAFVNNTAMSFTNCYFFYILPAINCRIISKDQNIDTNFNEQIKY